MKIFLGADHAGFAVKEKIKAHLERHKIPYEDLSPELQEKDDYPDYAFAVAKRVAKEKDAKGILVCGTGTGMAIAANKVKGIRAVAAYDAYSAKMSRADNDANILALRGRAFPFGKLQSIIGIWLKTKFSGKSRHLRRIRKIQAHE